MTNINITIKNLLNSLNSNILNLKKIKYQMDLISQYKESENFDYLNCLLYPEKYVNVRFPSQVTVPSATFQLKSSLNVSTNYEGCVLVKCNPFFLAQENVIGTSFVDRWDYSVASFYGLRHYVARNVTSLAYIPDGHFDGQITNYDFYWSPLNANQIVQNNVYDQYRLVSGSLQVQYIGNFEDARGFLGGSITFSKTQEISAETYFDAEMNRIPEYNFNPSANPHRTYFKANPDEYKFNILKDAYYNKEVSVLEGLRLLYFPLDNSFSNFKKIINRNSIYHTISPSVDGGMPTAICLHANDDSYKSGFNWYVYGQGLTPRKNCLKFDLCLNFECLPAAKFMNFIPVTMGPYGIPNKEMEMIRYQMKDLSIQKLNNYS